MRRVCFLLITLLSLSASFSLAIDAGDPLYLGDIERPFRQEVFFERFNRYSKVRSVEFEFFDPSGTFSGAIEDNDSVKSAANVLISRSSWHLSDYFALYSDIGNINEDGGGTDPGIIVGGGVRTILLDANPVKFTLLFNGHYVPGYDISYRGNGPLGRSIGEGEIGYWEGGIAVLGSIVLEPSDRLKMSQYLGFSASVLRTHADLFTSYPDSGASSKLEMKFREKNPVSLIAGTSLYYWETVSGRIEVRIGAERSLSAGLGMAF